MATFFVFWLGVRPIISISNPEHIKEILDDKFGHFPKPTFIPVAVRNLIGDTTSIMEGQKWAQHRRIVGSAFFKEKLKEMTPTMVSSVSKMFDKWHNQMDSGKMEIDVYEQFKVLTTDIIAHVACGSNSREANLVLKLQQEQKHLVFTDVRSIYSRFLPSPCNRYALRLKRELETIISNIIARRKYVDVGDDLLGILMEATHQKKENFKFNMKDVAEECKAAFLLGRETLSSLLTWTTMLLAINPEWQERTRAEVLLLCGKDFPTHNALQNLKIVGMVLNEVLRLYPPALQMERKTSKNIMLGNIVIPPNIKLVIPIIDLHCDPALWGPDALEFNPERFSHGIGNACKTPSAFFPFSMGPRVCLGKNYALLEARVILTMMLQQFRFSLSPGYKHYPVFSLTLEPQYGMQIIFEKIE